LTAGVVLDSNVSVTYRNILYQWNRLVGAHLGDGDGRGLVLMFACSAVEGKAIMEASSGTHFGTSAVESGSALVGRFMSMSASRAGLKFVY